MAESGANAPSAVEPLTEKERNEIAAQALVEQALGVRVVRVGEAHLYSSGIQVQHIHSVVGSSAHGKTRAVSPGEIWQLNMFQMLCHEVEGRLFPGEASKEEKGR